MASLSNQYRLNTNLVHSLQKLVFSVAFGYLLGKVCVNMWAVLDNFPGIHVWSCEGRVKISKVLTLLRKKG